MTELLVTAWLLLALAVIGAGALITDLISACVGERAAEEPSTEPAAVRGFRRRAGGVPPPPARAPHPL